MLEKLYQGKINDIIVLILSLTIISNYLSLFFIFNIFFIKFHLTIYLITLLYFLLNPKIGNLHLKIAIIFLIILSLGDATEAWDAWACWLFKAKRIYLDQSVFGVLDNYAKFQNNDQPQIAPAFASTVSIFFGKWDQIFPKIGFLFIFFPPLILSLNIFHKNLSFIFLCTTLYIINTFFINGLLDGLISIYFVFSLYLTFNIFVEEKFTYLKFFNLFSFLIILSLLKHEGLVLILIIFMQIFLIGIIKKNLFKNLNFKILLILSLIPILMWKYIVFNNGITNIHLNSQSLFFFNERILSLETYILIIRYFFTSYSLLFSILFLICTSIISKNTLITKYAFSSGFIYIFLVLLVNLFSGLDFKWALSTSFNRVISMPVCYTFSFFALYQIKLYKFKFLKAA